MTTMKAILFEKYGGPEVLELKEIEKPLPRDNEVQIKIHAVSANPADWHIIRGKPFIARFTSGLIKPKNPIPGMDVSGVVESVGKACREFKPGDDVFGACGWGGGFAESICLTENNVVVKPSGTSFEEASTLNVAAITALQGLRYKGNPQPAEKVLINGASGGVGTFAVQIARSHGAIVTAVCSGKNDELVRSIGADHVIDYTTEDFTRSGRKFDLLFDAIGNRSLSDLKRVLEQNGRCVIAGFTSLGLLFQHMALAPMVSKKKGKDIGMMPTAHATKEDLTILRGLVESGKIRPVIDKVYPLDESAEAIRYLETGRARGKVVIRVV